MQLMGKLDNVFRKGDSVTRETAEWLLSRQRRCVECGSTAKLEIHHRIPRSAGQRIVQEWCIAWCSIYEKEYNRILPVWTLHDVQNLVVLCQKHHAMISDGDEALDCKYRMSFTCPHTGFNVPFQRPSKPFIY